MLSNTPQLLDDEIKFFTINKLGQIYAVHKDNSITKFNTQGNEVMTRNLKVQGNLHSLDATNVFDILLFYKDLNTIITADNLLNQRNLINFNENDFSGTRLISAASRSFDNKIWVFDIISQRLLKVDGLGKIELQSSSLPNQTQLNDVHHIIESSPHVFLIDSFRIIKMNIYGKLLSQVKSKAPLRHAYVFSDTLFVHSKDSLYAVNSNSSKLLLKSVLNKNQQWQPYQKGSLELRSDSLFLQK